MTYSGYLENTALGKQMMQTFSSLGVPAERIGTTFPTASFATNTANDPTVLNAASTGNQPLLIVDWYAPTEGATIPPSANWYAYGRNVAQRYQPNSPWLLSQGISELGSYDI